MSETIYTLYSDSFVAVDGTRWGIDIEQVGGEAPKEGKDTSLVFPADTPAEIEWAATAKLDALCPSALTLRIESTTDRRFLGLYRTTPGEVRVAVLRDGALYWCGLLDTELYEEPYAYTDGYDVSVSFSDLGQLKRTKWNLRDSHIPLKNAIEACLMPLRRNGEVPVIWHVSTTVAADGSCILTGAMIATNRFYDTDGEALSLSDTLEALLQPFALRVEQRNGAFHVYDLHALESVAPTPVQWDGTDASLGVDKVYNNVRVTFSPEVVTSLLDTTIEADDARFASEPPHTKDVPVFPDESVSDESPDLILPGFNMAWGKPAGVPEPFAQFNPLADIFRMRAEYSGSDCAGALWYYLPMRRAQPQGAGHIDGSHDGPLFVTKRVYIPSLSGYDYLLRVSLDMLMDCCDNPFERNRSVDEDHVKYLNGAIPFAYTGVALELYDRADGGLCLYHFDNEAAVRTPRVSSRSSGEWKAGQDIGGNEYGFSMFLSYYSDDRYDSSPLGGWASNRPVIGGYRGDLPSTWSKRGSGEFIPVPPRAGWLQLTVYAGTWAKVYGGISFGPSENDAVLAEITGVPKAPIKWLLYKDASIELRTASGRELDDVATGDVEFSAWLLREAEEELGLDTSIGSLTSDMPGALGVCLQTSTQAPITDYCRAGVTDCVEKLLIGTAYSQHAARHITLKGTVTIKPNFVTFADEAMPGTTFMRMGSVERLCEAEAEITLCELSPENYEGIEYEQE